MSEATDIARPKRWGGRYRVEGVTTVFRGAWAAAADEPDSQRLWLALMIDRLLAQADAKGADLGDFTISVGPDGAGNLSVHLRGVSA